MRNLDYIIQLCHEINQQGKTPSVALIRNKASQTLSIPEVIKALQSWKANPRQSTPQLTKAPDRSNVLDLSLEERISQLEEQLAKVTEQLATLTALKNT
jgi:DNA-binding transcriptional MerR regulator